MTAHTTTAIRFVSVFNFTHYRDYLCMLVAVQRQRRGTSLMGWSRLLGYRSPRTFAMVLNGQRLPSLDLSKRLIQALKLSAHESRYFELLVAKAKAEAKNLSLEPYMRELAKLASARPTEQMLDAQAFTFIADWYPLALRQLLRSRKVIGTATNLHRALRVKIPLRSIEAALRRMLALRLAKLDENGVYQTTPHQLITTTDIPSEALRSHHAQMLEQAKLALEHEPVHRREMSSSTILMDPSRLTEAKEVLRQFRDEFKARFDCIDSAAVFQLNLQLFSHSHFEEENLS